MIGEYAVDEINQQTKLSKSYMMEDIYLQLNSNNPLHKRLGQPDVTIKK